MSDVPSSPNDERLLLREQQCLQDTRQVGDIPARGDAHQPVKHGGGDIHTARAFEYLNHHVQEADLTRIAHGAEAQLRQAWVPGDAARRAEAELQGIGIHAILFVCRVALRRSEAVALCAASQPMLLPTARRRSTLPGYIDMDILS